MYRKFLIATAWVLGFGLLVVLGTVPSVQIAATTDWSLAQLRSLFGAVWDGDTGCSGATLTMIARPETSAPLVVWVDLSGDGAKADKTATDVFPLLGAVNLGRLRCDAKDLSGSAAVELARSMAADLLISGAVAADNSALLQLTYASGSQPADYSAKLVSAPSGAAFSMVIATFALRFLDLALPPDSYQQLLKQPAPTESLQKATLAEALGIAALSEGRMSSAVEAFQTAASIYQAIGQPERHARAMRWLGDAYAVDVRTLEAATIAYRGAILDTMREKSPLEWARLQHDLAETLLHFGELTGQSDRIELAIATYRAALTEVPRARAPQVWAQYQFGLGSALLAYGRLSRDPVILQSAVSAFALAANERALAPEPLAFAQTQAALGQAYQLLGETSNRSDDFVLAADAFDAAQQAWPADQEAAVRSKMLIGQGIALQRLGEQFGQLGKKERAAEALAAALIPELRAKDQTLWAETQGRLGALLYTLGVENSSPGWLSQSEVAYRAALEVIDRNTRPQDWAATSLGLGRTLLSQGEMMPSTMALQQARIAIGDALLVPVPLQDELSFAKAELLNATAIRALIGLDLQKTDLAQAWDLALDARMRFVKLQAPHYIYQADRLLRLLAARLKK